MRIVAIQFGILFALLAFSSQVLAGSALGIAVLIGFSTGVVILLTLFATDAAIDRYLGRKYGMHGKNVEEASVATEARNTSRNHGTGGNRAA